MPKYEVVIDIGSYRYHVEAPNENKAQEIAMDMFETHINDQRELQNNMEYWVGDVVESNNERSESLHGGDLSV